MQSSYISMDDDLKRRVLELVTRLQRQYHDASTDLLRLQEELLSHAAGGARPPAEPRTQVERVAAYFYERRNRSVTKEQLREALPDINDNSLGSVLRQLDQRSQIRRVGRGAYRWASAGLS